MDLFNRFSHKKTCRILADDSSRVARKYRHFKEFLDHNHACLSGIADLENLYHGGAAFEMEPVRSTCDGIILATHDLTRCLNRMTDDRYEALVPPAEKIAADIRRRLGERPDYGSIPFVRPLDEVQRDIVGFTGSKAADRAAVRKAVGLPAPAGFVITAITGLGGDRCEMEAPVRAAESFVRGEGSSLSFLKQFADLFALGTLFEAAFAVKGLGELLQQVFQPDGFEQVVVGAGLHAFHAGFERGVAGEQNDLGLGADFLDFPQGLDPVHSARHFDVENDYVERRFLDQPDRLFSARAAEGFNFSFFEPVHEGFQKVTLVVDHQNGRLLHASSRYCR